MRPGMAASGNAAGRRVTLVGNVYLGVAVSKLTRFALACVRRAGKDPRVAEGVAWCHATFGVPPKIRKKILLIQNINI